MDLHIAGQHIEITDTLKSHITEKLAMIEKRFSKITQVRVSLHVDRADQIAESNLHIDGVEFHAKASTHDMYQSIDEMADKLLHQLTKHKEKLIDQHR